MSSSGFDNKSLANSARQQWNQVAGGWHNLVQDAFADWMAPITQRMFDLISLSEGDHVLDLAAGDGDQSLHAARRVGPTGRILATDLSERLLAYAEQAASAAGLANVETRALNAEELDELTDASFDAVICRLGLMLFPNRQQALSESRRVLKDNGHIGVMVFTAPANTPWLSIPVKIALEHAKLPPQEPGQPGIFGMGAPGAVEDSLREAGFHAIQTEIYAAPISFESSDVCVQYIREGAGAIHAALSKLSPDQQQAAWDEIARALKPFEMADGFQAPTEVMIGTAMKPVAGKPQN